MNNGKYKAQEIRVNKKRITLKDFLRGIFINRKLSLLILLVLISLEVANGFFRGDLFSILVAMALFIPLATIYIKLKKTNSAAMYETE